jgi:hypothetical protein
VILERRLEDAIRLLKIKLSAANTGPSTIFYSTEMGHEAKLHARGGKLDSTF